MRALERQIALGPPKVEAVEEGGQVGRVFAARRADQDQLRRAAGVAGCALDDGRDAGAFEDVVGPLPSGEVHYAVCRARRCDRVRDATLPRDVQPARHRIDENGVDTVELRELCRELSHQPGARHDRRITQFGLGHAQPGESHQCHAQ